MDLQGIQAALRERNFDAWLFYDHHHRDPIAYSVLGLREDSMVTRRWFYVIPDEGEPRKLVHRIEAGHLDALPGETVVAPGHGPATTLGRERLTNPLLEMLR